DHSPQLESYTNLPSTTKLWDETRSLWEQISNPTKRLHFGHVVQFLTSRYEVVEKLNSIRHTKNQYSQPKRANKIHT
ncbi:unnamed protein product, partial [Ceratitis capitata]